jgi:hypothetical protein
MNSRLRFYHDDVGVDGSQAIIAASDARVVYVSEADRVWAMDLVHGQLYDGCKIPVLTMSIRLPDCRQRQWARTHRQGA